MVLSWNEIIDRSLKFTKEWEGESRERAEKDSFWNDFFDVFGINRKRVAIFEAPVKKLSGNQGFIDLFWKGVLLVEHKSQGKDLDKAFTQAQDYFPGIKEHELPKYILVSDFERFKLYDLDEGGTEVEFHIKDFHKNVKHFGFIAGYQKRTYKAEDPVNIKAAYLLGNLHQKLEKTGYEGHALEVFLVRILFCLFADDSGIFEKDSLKFFIEEKTKEDGSDLGAILAQLFQVLNTPEDKRLKNLDPDLNQFRYVNGKLFEEVLPISSFNSGMRDVLLEACSLDWGQISPAIFGSMFQSVMNPKERRDLGAHYTSETNILKLIKPLFLDELYEEFNKAKLSTNKLQQFHQKLSTLKFMDPACGCGNFLVITYRELRLLELEVLRLMYKNQMAISIERIISIDVDQFYGIEYDEWPARIAEVALWLMDHQMNMMISEEFGHYFIRLPLKKGAKIINGNALRIDWEEVVSKSELSYIIGNPPFVGAAMKNKTQIDDMNLIFGNKIKHGKLDYVAAWYYLAAKFISNTQIKAAFVSTNSITQGEQVSILWRELMVEWGQTINFAHTTFNWKNDAKGKAAVHCVIIGFSQVKTKKYLFNYYDVNAEPDLIDAKNISPYLINGKDVFIDKTRNPICGTPKMIRGSIPYDNGNLLLSNDEKEDVILNNPKLAGLIRRYGGANEMLNNEWRYCFWLRGVNPTILLSSKYLTNRLEKCKAFREGSTTKSVRAKSSTPAMFGNIRQPTSDYLMIPRVSSHKRKYLPIEYISSDTILADSAYGLPDATLFQFGVLQSMMHNVWIKTVAGRLKSDYRYSSNVVYNNFPWPLNMDEKKQARVEEKAKKVLEIRKHYKNTSLANLYNIVAMPPEMVKAHTELDKAVDLCYRTTPFKTDISRIEFLFDLYLQYSD